MKLIAALLVFVISGCDGVNAAGGRGGPPITEASPPYSEWSLDSAPVVRIGAVEGPSAYQLSRVVYAGRLSDGRFVVMDGGSNELRWFDSAGHFEVRSGGRGQGPGEFLSVVGATVTPEDTLVLYDARNQRLTWFGPEGSLARTVHIGLLGQVTLVPFEGSRLLISEERPTYNFGRAEYNAARDSMLAMVTRGAGEALDTVLRRPGREAATWVDYTEGTATAHRQVAMPFGHRALVGAVAGRIVMVESGQQDLAYVDQEGEVVRRARRTDVNPPLLSDALRREYVTYVAHQAKAGGRQEGPAEVGAERLLELLPQEHRLPAFDRILSDPVSGRVWVRDYVLPWNIDEPQYWTVDDSSGRVLARVTTPAGLNVMQVSPRYVAGVQRDEMGVEYVVVYLLKTAA